MDKVSKQVRRKIMQAIKSKNTSIELKFRKELFKRKIRYRVNVSSLYGHPDIAIKKYKLVIFLDSCFWHCCPKHFRMPKSNLEYWQQKIKRNKNRDNEVNNYYKNRNWVILRYWECQIKNNFNQILDETVNAINRQKENYYTGRL